MNDQPTNAVTDPHDAIEHVALPIRNSLSSVASRCLSSFTASQRPFTLPVPPTGAIYLNVLIQGSISFDLSHVENLPAPRLYFGGQLHREMPITHLRGPLLLVGIAFRPTGFYRLFGSDASELTDRVVPVEEVDVALAKQLDDALPGIDSPEAGAALLQDLLLDRLPAARQPGLCERAVEELEACGGRMGINSLSERCHVSRRHLQRLFMRQVGLPPKTYAKIVQLNQVVTALQSGESEAMNQVALANGYYDQAHFIRDFSRLVGSNPGEFLASRDPFLRIFLGRKLRD